jgi:hypothetical protein
MSAADKSRTCTPVRALAPEASVSAISPQRLVKIFVSYLLCPIALGCEGFLKENIVSSGFSCFRLSFLLYLPAPEAGASAATYAFLAVFKEFAVSQFGYIDQSGPTFTNLHSDLHRKTLHAPAVFLPVRARGLA